MKYLWGHTAPNYFEHCEKRRAYEVLEFEPEPVVDGGIVVEERPMTLEEMMLFGVRDGGSNG